MKQIMFGLAAAMSLTAADAASATDWWMLSRPPAGQTALFADAETVERLADGSVSVRVMRIDREGQATDTVERVTCRGGDPLSRFACASPEDRENYGLILASMDPAQAARILFDMPPVGGERR